MTLGTLAVGAGSCAYLRTLGNQSGCQGQGEEVWREKKNHMAQLMLTDFPAARSKQTDLLDDVSMAIGVDLRGMKFPFRSMLLIIQNSVVGK